MLRPGDLPSAFAAMQYSLGFPDTEPVRHGHLTIVVHAPTTTTTRDCHQLRLIIQSRLRSGQHLSPKGPFISVGLTTMLLDVLTPHGV